MGIEENGSTGCRAAAALVLLIAGFVVQSAAAQPSRLTPNIGGDDLAAALERYGARQQSRLAQSARTVDQGMIPPDSSRAIYDPKRSPSDTSSPDIPNGLPGRFDSLTLNLNGTPALEASEEDVPISACSFLLLDEGQSGGQPTQQSGAEKDAPPASTSPHDGQSLEEINNKLNNPGADLASLNFKLTWNQFRGDLQTGANTRRGMRFRPSFGRRSSRGRSSGNVSLGAFPNRSFGSSRHRSLGAFLGRSWGPSRSRLRGLLLNPFKRSSGGDGPSSQNSLTLNFQPVFPFKLADGGNFLVRPSIPVVWQPHYDARKGGFDEQFGIGDSQLVAFYSRTNTEKGYMWGAGVTTQFPTHTDDVLGKNQFQMGPAAFAGLMGKWGSAGLFPQHFWNIGGSDEGYTALTVIQPWYWFNVGKGYQVGGSPAISYDWAQDESNEAWIVPVNLGLAKTIMVGKTPVKLKFEGMYYIVSPDAFGPHWGLQLTITPVIPNPFAGLLGK